MAGEQGYPWTVMQKTRDQDEGGDQSFTGPWIAAWRWKPGHPILILSTRILGHLALPRPEGQPEAKHAVGLFMDAQQEDPFLFKNRASAIRMRDEIRVRSKADPRWSALFDCRAVTKEELDKWKIENALEQIASESEPGVST